jgi:hypothetical protein
VREQRLEKYDGHLSKLVVERRAITMDQTIPWVLAFFE